MKRSRTKYNRTKYKSKWKKVFIIMGLQMRNEREKRGSMGWRLLYIYKELTLLMIDIIYNILI